MSVGGFLQFLSFIGGCFSYSGTKFEYAVNPIREMGQGTMSLVGRGVKPHKRFLNSR